MAFMMQNSPAVIPNNSLDWRFLLPITSETKILVIGRECGYIQQYFINLGLSEVYCCTDADLPLIANSNDNKIQKKILTYADLEMRPEMLSFFDVVAYPHGFSQMPLPSGEIESLENCGFIKRFMRPGGVIFIGFANGLFSRKGTRQAGSYYSYPRLMKKKLKKTGYTLSGVYGAVPDQFIPEYVFPLTPQAIGFIVKHRYTYKVPGILLRLMASPVAATILANFFPSYFVVATVNL